MSRHPTGVDDAAKHDKEGGPDPIVDECVVFFFRNFGHPVGFNQIEHDVIDFSGCSTSEHETEFDDGSYSVHEHEESAEKTGEDVVHVVDESERAPVDDHVRYVDSEHDV